MAKIMPASFRGVKFAVSETETSGGQRIALHQYPGRNDPWAEPMGRAVRRFRLSGFVLDGDLLLGGATIAMQRAALIAACEQVGPGTLVHPTLGSLNVVLERFSIGEDLGAGKSSTVTIECIESGKQIFPAVAVDQQGIATAAAKMKTAATVNALSKLRKKITSMLNALNSGGKLADVLTEVTKWTSLVFMLSADATALYRLSSVLSGSYGRFAAGGNSGLTGSNPTAYSASTTVDDLVAVASASRVAVANASTALKADAVALTADSLATIPADIIALIDALAAACADPSDAIRLMLEIIAFAAPGYATPMAVPVSTMIVRAAAAALATAVASYQPQSSDDAAEKISFIAPVLDGLATAAADAGDDESYDALSACRVAIVNELRAKGATLPQIRTFAFGQTLPALALAQAIYGDPTRADQLLTQVNPPNPLFMPTSFQALAA